MAYYRELFRLNYDEVDHGDPHLLFENISTAINKAGTLENNVRVMWDCEHHEYVFMVNDYEG